MNARPTHKIGSNKQLFLDDFIISRRENSHLRFHRPSRHPHNPIFRPDVPWEKPDHEITTFDGIPILDEGVYLFGGTLIYDEEAKLFKMWYRINKPIHPDPSGYGWTEEKGSYRTAYAVSEDGLNWERPVLDLFEYEGSTANNILPPDERTGAQIRRPNLIKDYEDPKHLYKMAYMDQFGGRWGLTSGFSTDGIHWNMNVGPPSFFESPVAPNGITFGWDSNTERFIHFHRMPITEHSNVDGHLVRGEIGVVRSTSHNFSHWGDTRAVAWRQDDDPQGWSPGEFGILTAIMYTESLYIGVLDTCTTYQLEDVPIEHWDVIYRNAHAEHIAELVISRDGIQWTRVAPHWEFFSKGLWGEWDSYTVTPTKPIVHDNKILFYYTARDLPDKAVIPQIKNKRLGFAIGLATMRLDGFVSVEGYENGGALTTRKVRFQGDRLILNAKTSSASARQITGSKPRFGMVTVELLDENSHVIDGYSENDCDAFTGDDVRHIMTWNGNPNVQRLEGVPIMIRFRLTNSALYSFQFRGKQEPKSPMNLLSPGARGHP